MAGDKNEKPKKFQKGDLVWARVKGFPFWPGKVSWPKEDDDIKIPSSGTHEFITFYGSDTYSFVHPDQIFPYEEFKHKYANPTKTPYGLADAITDLEKALVRKKAKEAGEEVDESSESSAESVKEEEVEVVPENDVSTNKRKVPRRKSSVAFTQKLQLKEDEGVDEEGSYMSSSKEVTAESSEDEELMVKKGGGKRKSAPHKSKESPKEKKKKKEEEEEEDEETSIPADEIPSSSAVVQEFLASEKQPCKISFEFSHHPTFLPDILPQQNPSDSFRVGFLGLGKMGSLLARGLLNAGLNVMVWNRTPSKCKGFMELGAEKGSTPAEVVQCCDVIISCVSDAKALKDLLSGSSGVLDSICAGKSFVDMSTVDVHTITELNQEIVSRGGRFLESPVIGSLDSNVEELVVVCSGDRSLFDDCCSTCFSAVTKKAFYFGSVGTATCVKLVINMLQATLLAGLAECLALGEKLGLDQSLILSLLALLPLSSQLNTLKGDAMITNQLSSRQLSLEHMQRDVRLALSLAELVQQPLYITSATNELFKKAKARGYGDHDTAAIYRATD